MGFALLVVMAYAAWWIFGSVQCSEGAGILFALIDYSFLLVGIIGMIWSLVAWFVAGAVASRRARTSLQKDLSHV